MKKEIIKIIKKSKEVEIIKGDMRYVVFFDKAGEYAIFCGEKGNGCLVKIPKTPFGKLEFYPYW